MSVVEPAPAMDEAAARRLTMRIRLQLDAIAANVEQVILLIEQAKNDNIHEVLGYTSWTAYVSEEFGGQLTRLSVAERRPVVEILADTGMSTRAIAPVMGVSHATVARDLETRRQVSHCETPGPVDLPDDEVDEILVMADATEEQFDAAIAEAKAEGDLARQNVLAHLPRRQVTGTDGKTYTVTAATGTRRRSPLPDAYFRAVYDLEKVVNRLSRLHADDRFLGNREGLRARHLPTIERLAEAVLQIEDELGDVR